MTQCKWKLEWIQWDDLNGFASEGVNALGFESFERKKWVGKQGNIHVLLINV